jgi:hypothetical protein
MTITAASKLRIGASTTLLSLLFIIQENQPLDTVSSLAFAPYSSSFFSFEKWRTAENPPWRLERMVAAPQ